MSDYRGGIEFRQITFDGDEDLVTWLKASAGIAEALGISVLIEPHEEPGRIRIQATRLFPRRTWDDLRALNRNDPVLRLVPTPKDDE